MPNQMDNYSNRLYLRIPFAWSQDCVENCHPQTTEIVDCPASKICHSAAVWDDERCDDVGGIAAPYCKKYSQYLR